MRRWIFACACFVALAACSKAGAPLQGHGNSLVVAFDEEPVSLNPLYLEGTASYAISEIGYSYLTNYDSHGAIVGDLAAVPTLANGGISRDGTRVVYKLRRGVKWQDGAPLTSRDVAFTYRAIVNPANIIPSRYGYDQVAAVDTPDTLTVVVRLKRPYSPIISYFFGGDSNYPVLPAHLLASLPNLNHAAFNEAPVGSGPFAFARWSRGDAIETKANATYYAGRPGLDGVTLRFVHDSSTTIAQLTTHEVDAAFATDVARIDELRAVPNHRVVVTPVPYFYAVLFNVTDPLLSDGAVRHAFALAIDRRSLVGKVTHGLYDPDTGMRGLFTWAFDPRAGNVPYDPRAAADLLSRDGWIPGPDGIRVKSGRRLEIQLATRTGMQIDSEFAVIVAAQERAVGIDVEQKRYSPEQFFATDGPIMQGRYQAGIYGYQSSYDPDVSWLLACSQRGPNGFNDARYCNAAVDRALRDGSSSFDRASRMRDYAFVQRQILADLPYDFLCQTSQIDVIPTNLEGYDPPLLSPFTSIARWRLR